MTATATPAPARLALRLQDALLDHGGAITRADLVGYLATLFACDRCHVRDVLLEEAAAGTVVLTDAPSTSDDHPRQTTVARPELG